MMSSGIFPQRINKNIIRRIARIAFKKPLNRSELTMGNQSSKKPKTYNKTKLFHTQTQELPRSIGKMQKIYCIFTTHGDLCTVPPFLGLLGLGYVKSFVNKDVTF